VRKWIAGEATIPESVARLLRLTIKHKIIKLTSYVSQSTTAHVKVCGWRPHEGGAAHTGAGVRKPPREETAGGLVRLRVSRYGDFGAGGLSPRSVG
jgi:hypothetical protein